MHVTKPKWQKEIESFKGIKSTFIIEGNIHDVYPVFERDTVFFLPLNEALYRVFNPSDSSDGYDFLFCDPTTGLYDIMAQSNLSERLRLYESGKTPAKPENDDLFGTAYKVENNERLSEIVKTAILKTDMDTPKDSHRPVAVVINFASRFISDPNELDECERNMFLNLMFASLNSPIIRTQSNTIIFVVEKYNDLPAWFYYNNPKVRTVSIPFPDRSDRASYIGQQFSSLLESKETKREMEKFIDITEGLKILELKELRTLVLKNEMPVSELQDAVAIYKYGVRENMWNSVDKTRIQNAKQEIEKRVMGQRVAVDKTILIIKRAVTGLSGMQHSSGKNKPRGVLFLAGPTGTGKTELTKAVAEMLFGDEQYCIRFDMSEYSQEHADQKLFGAPPGYVGYEAGGQLTNAIKERPFSILLFDEIEKAHPTILDKFLQILEDGRMTDGQGNTVYFSEALIVFTSNLGMTKMEKNRQGERIRVQNISIEEPFEEIEKKVQAAVMGNIRLELYNRIGKSNIIVFDFIRKDVSDLIVESKINNINKRILKQNKITVDASKCYEYFCQLAQNKEVLEMGGRGIGNLIEDKYINPLSEFIFDQSCQEESKVIVHVDKNKIVFSKEE